MKPRILSTASLAFPLTSAITAFLAAPSAKAASGTWTQTTAGTYNWSDTANWSGGTVADGATFNAAFNLNGGVTAPLGNIITTLNTARTIGGISRGGNGTSTQANWTITHASNVLTLDNGASNVSISNSANAGSTLTVDTNIQLLSNLVLTANGNNGAAITLGSVAGALSITGTKDITISSSSGFGNGAITINNNISTSGSFTNAQTGTGGGAVTVNGIIGPNVTGVTQRAAGTAGNSMILTGANTYTGATTIGTAGSAASGGVLTVSGTAGTINASSGYTINGTGSRLVLDNALGNVDRLKNTGSAVTLNLGGELSLTGNATANTTETITSLALGTGSSIVTVSSASSRITTLAVAGALSRTNFSTGLVRGSSLGGGPGSFVGRITLGTAPTGADFIGTNTLNNAASGDATQALKIVPWLLGHTTTTGTGNGFVTYDTTLGLRVLTAAQMTTLAADSTTAASPVNATAFNGTVTASGLTVNSLLFNAASQTLNGSGALTVNSGAVATVAATAAIGSGFSSLVLGNGEGIVTATGANVLAINTPINVTSSGGLTKTGGGTVILGVASGILYAGQTTVNEGILQIGSGTAGDLGSYASAIVLNGGSLAFGRTNPGLTISNAISGIGGVTQNGAGGTTVLSGLSSTAASNYTGTTTIDQGTLAITHATTAALTGGLTFGAAAGSANIGTLYLTGANATFAGNMLVQTNSASANTITIGSGKTLATNGNVTIGAGNNAVTATNLTVSGATAGVGSWTITNTSGSGLFQVGVGNGTNDATTTVDLSDLGTFNANLGASSTFRVGANAATSGTSVSTLKLAPTSTITATTLGVGDQAQPGGVNILSLGTGVNTINANNIRIGQAANNRSSGEINFQHASNGSLIIRDQSGASNAANLTMINSGNSGANSFTSNLLMAGHNANVSLNALVMASKSNGTGGATAAITFDNGTFSALTTTMTGRSGTSLGGTSSGTITISGGTASLGAVTMAVNTNTNATTGLSTALLDISNGAVTATTINMANAVATGSVKTATANINLSGGSLTLGGNITRTGGAGTENATITLNGGTLNMAGFNIGGASAISLLAQAGALQNVATINGSGGLTKTTAGTLTLEGPNAYSGNTNVDGGKLVIAGNQTGVGQLIVSNAATLTFGDGSSTNGSSVNSGTIFVNNTGTVQINKANGGTVTNAIASNPSATTTLSGVNSTGTTNTFTATSYNNGGGFAVNSANSGATLAFSGASGAIDLKGTNLTVSGAGDTLLTSAGQGFYSSTTSSKVIKQGGGTLIFQGNQGFTGNMEIDAGTVRVDIAQTASGTYFVGNGTTTGTSATLLLGGGAVGLGGGVSFNRTVSINPGNGTNRTIGGTNTSGTNSFSSAIDMSGAFGENRSVTLTAATGGTVEINGIVSGSGQNISKSGGGTVVLGNSNSYTGTTTVSAGSLIINGNQSTATGAVGVSNSDTRLMGTGTVGGATTINAAAIHSAGNGTGAVGTQNFSSSLTYANGSIFEWDINADDTATGFDKVAVTGALNGSTGGDTSIFRVVFGTTAKAGVNDSGNVFWNTPSTSQVWSMTSLFGKNFTSGLFTSVQTYDSVGAFDVSSKGSFTITGSALTWSAVPEPTTALAGLLLGAGLLRRRRNVGG